MLAAMWPFVRLRTKKNRRAHVRALVRGRGVRCRDGGVRPGGGGGGAAAGGAPGAMRRGGPVAGARHGAGGGDLGVLPRHGGLDPAAAVLMVLDAMHGLQAVFLVRGSLAEDADLLAAALGMLEVRPRMAGCGEPGQRL